MITFAEACERVQRLHRLVSRRDVLVHASREYDTHWAITYAVPSLEDSARMFQYATNIVEKETGYVYYPPSRCAPIDIADLFSVRREWVRITPQDMEELNKEY